MSPVVPLPFDEMAIGAIAAELRVPTVEAPYRVKGSPVFELRVPCAALPGAHVLVVLWPSLRRVDVRLVPPGGGTPALAVTCKHVAGVEIYPDVEVMFRRASGGVFFVTRHGVAAASD